MRSRSSCTSSPFIIQPRELLDSTGGVFLSSSSAVQISELIQSLSIIIHSSFIFSAIFFVVVGVVVHAIWSDVSKEVGGDHFEIFFVVNDARSLISNSMTFRGSLYSRGENSAHGRAYKILNKIIIIIIKKETRHRRRLNVRSNFVIFGYVFVLCGVVVFGGDD